jgi:hypothetical protein
LDLLHPKNLPVSVDGLPVGRRLWDSHTYGGMTTTPVMFEVNDTQPEAKVKGLASIMISFAPDKKPSVTNVLKEMEALLGMHDSSMKEIL